MPWMQTSATEQRLRFAEDFESGQWSMTELCERHGRLRKHRRRKQWTHPGAAPLETQRPNQVWPADFKGQFKTRDGQYCYPLTVTDHFSRTLLVCRGLASVKTALTQPVFRALFR